MEHIREVTQLDMGLGFVSIKPIKAGTVCIEDQPVILVVDVDQRG